MVENRIRGISSIGGGALMLICDFNALCEIEAHFEDDLEEGLRKIDEGDLTLQDQRAVVAALLRHDQPHITARMAGDLISEHFDEIGEAIRRAISLALPEPDAGKKPTRRKAARV